MFLDQESDSFYLYSYEKNYEILIFEKNKLNFMEENEHLKKYHILIQIVCQKKKDFLKMRNIIYSALDYILEKYHLKLFCCIMQQKKE